MSTSFRAATLFTGLLHLAVGLWSSIVLSNPAPSAVLRAYVITECFFGYLGFMMSLFHGLRGKRSCFNGVLECTGIGLFIWNAILLFYTLGIPQSPTSPYAYFVYVHFFLVIAVMCVGALVLCCVCCGVGALLFKEATEPAAPAPVHVSVPPVVAAAEPEDPVVIMLEA